jgi:hypothetical protein
MTDDDLEAKEEALGEEMEIDFLRDDNRRLGGMVDAIWSLVYEVDANPMGGGVVLTSEIKAMLIPSPHDPEGVLRLREPPEEDDAVRRPSPRDG